MSHTHMHTRANVHIYTRIYIDTYMHTFIESILFLMLITFISNLHRLNSMCNE